MTTRLKLGRKGEKLAVKLLKAKGLEILKRNFISENRTGEIDIVARDGKIICFVEVKMRSSSDEGNSENSDEAWLRAHQAERIKHAANDYLDKIGGHALLYRFDLIELAFDKFKLKSAMQWENNFGLKGV